LKNKDQDMKFSHHIYNQIRTGELKRTAKDSAEASQMQPILPRLPHPQVTLPQPFVTKPQG
jgi:membrane-bound lytic murein transglycosylase MltF